MKAAYVTGIQSATRALLAMGGETIIYRPASGGSVTIQGLIHRGTYETIETDTGRYWQKTAELIVLNDSVDGVVGPHYDDRCEFDGALWDVVAVKPDAGVHVIHVERRELVSVRRTR